MAKKKTSKKKVAKKKARSKKSSSRRLWRTKERWPNIYVEELNSWDSFKNITSGFLGADRRSSFLFRGQREVNWPLAPTFDRWLPNVQRSARDELEDSLLENFRIECRADVTLKELLDDEIATLALAQHFGLPTRLLDWSASPYVAAFFAFEKLVDNARNLMNDRDDNQGPVIIWALDKESYIWKKNRGVEIVDPPSWHNERLRNQDGKFTLSRTPFQSLQEYVAQYPDEKNALTAFAIPSREARDAMADLELMGINHSSLFPGRDGWSQAAKMKTILGIPADERIQRWGKRSRKYPPYRSIRDITM